MRVLIPSPFTLPSTFLTTGGPAQAGLPMQRRAGVQCGTAAPAACLYTPARPPSTLTRIPGPRAATAACCICGRSGRGAAATRAVTRHPTSRGIRATSMLPLWGDGHPPRQSRILARPVSAAPQSCPAPHTRAAACPSPIPPSTRVRSPGWRDPASLGARACKLQKLPLLPTVIFPALCITAAVKRTSG